MVKIKAPEMPKKAIRSISENELAALESEALEKVTKTIELIDDAVSAWDASKDKPAELAPRIMKLKSFHEALSEWGERFGKVKATRAGMDRRLGILRDFVGICNNYQR